MSREKKLKMVSIDEVTELEPDLTAKPSSDPLDVFRGGVSVPPPGSLQMAGGENTHPEASPVKAAPEEEMTSALSKD